MTSRIPRRENLRTGLRGRLPCPFFVLLAVGLAWGQQDQGAIRGIVQDSTGAVVPGAQVTLTNVDTGLVLETRTDKSGVYTFDPLKIGNYALTATAPGFAKTTHTSLHLDVQQRLAVNFSLKPGSVSETVQVTGQASVLQTEEASVGQVFDSKAIDDAPLNGRNYVYMIQLTNGAVSSQYGFRAGGSGGFSSNGQKAEQNNFLLDGVDNNVNVVDYVNGATYAVRPPPEAIEEFKVQTGDYSAEFGHSYGAVVNATMKSGTNQIHGNVWEYVRNDAFQARDYFNPSSCPAAGCPLEGDTPGAPAEFRENQFGADLGFPVIKNKLFFFGDIEDSRVVQGQISGNVLYTVPTLAMRQGDFSEMLNTQLITTAPVQLYEPGSNGTAKLGSACGNPNNVMCASEINSTAQTLLNLFPLPNTGTGNTPGHLQYGQELTYNNYLAAGMKEYNDTLHWDVKVDYNHSAKDRAFVRYSNSNNDYHYGPAPLGILDGLSFFQVPTRNVDQTIAVSETHAFSPTLANEVRFAYNYADFTKFQLNADNPGAAAALGFGGIPVGPSNGGLPSIGFSSPGLSSLSGFGAAGYLPSIEHQNIWEVLDNLIKTTGRHTFRMGFTLQPIRFSTIQPPNSRGSYYYSGQFTSLPGSPLPTGSGTADFLADYQTSANLSNFTITANYRWANGIYFQDDWKTTKHLTLNLGLRWEVQTPAGEATGQQANFVPNLKSLKCVPDPINGPAVCDASVSATYYIPDETPIRSLPPAFCCSPTSYLGSYPTPVRLENTSNRYLSSYSKRDFAPRIGVAYQVNDRLVVRSGFGIFYGAIESIGYGGPNLAFNYPFETTAGFYSACSPGACATTDGVTLKKGFPAADLGQGFLTAAASQGPQLDGFVSKLQTPYTMQTNLTMEYKPMRNTTATLWYSGVMTRHILTPTFQYEGLAGLDIYVPYDTAYLTGPYGAPFAFENGGPIFFSTYGGLGNYHSLNAKLNRRFSNGIDFLATYTYSHAMDDYNGNYGINGGGGGRGADFDVIPIRDEYASSIYDVRHRFTFLGGYELPFGKGRRWLNRGGFLDYVLGGWRSSLTFTAEAGRPFSISSIATNLQMYDTSPTVAQKIGDPFKGGGTITVATPTATGLTAGNSYNYSTGGTAYGLLSNQCPAQVHNLVNWYNPCAFVNPPTYTSSPYPDLAQSSPTSCYNGDLAHCLPALTTLAQLRPYLGTIPGLQVTGPGWNRVDMSVFKRFPMPWKDGHFLEFRADAFNLLNHPTFSGPSDTNLDGTAGVITSTLVFQDFTVNPRAFQFGLKYIF
ncbi:MAG TPA: carboxypeptidase regulatory-like domain-containing protein [Terriglobales bacterium]|nr:carboxypeptidase regulatory-like domain-containing protein [Terriglobales bacterium]